MIQIRLASFLASVSTKCQNNLMDLLLRRKELVQTFSKYYCTSLCYLQRHVSYFTAGLPPLTSGMENFFKFCPWSNWGQSWRGRWAFCYLNNSALLPDKYWVPLWKIITEFSSGCLQLNCKHKNGAESIWELQDCSNLCTHMNTHRHKWNIQEIIFFQMSVFPHWSIVVSE